MDTAPNRILVIDDDALLRKMCVSTLLHSGFEVMEAGDGESGLAVFAAAQIDLVLLDVQMAGIDGFETCRRLRALPGGDSVPVIMLTGLDDTVSIETAYEAGATDFIAKPFQWVLLTQRVRYSLRSAAAAAARVQTLATLARAQQLAQLGTWQVQLDGTMHCSDQLARIYGVPPGQAHCATPELFLERVVIADRQRMEEVRRQLHDAGSPYEEMYVIERFDGVVRTVYEQAQVVRDPRGNTLHVEGVTQDITDRAEAERRIRHLSLHDVLTGLPNRDFFQKLVAAGLEQNRGPQHSSAVLQLDVDRFKSVNDALGVAAGDMVLRTLAERLQGAIRGPRRGRNGTRGNVLGRVGPNSLAIFLPGAGGTEEVAAVAAHLLALVAEPMQIGAHEVRLTATMGMALAPRDASDSHALLRFAEQALYAAKRTSRGTCLFFDESINADARSMLAREVELRRAVEGDQLRVYLQPKFDVLTREVIGAEALVRWEHPERGLLLPMDFLPIAETTGLIETITEWMLEQTCRLLSGWQRAGRCPVPVAVNVSPAWFMSERMTSNLEPQLARHGLAPQQLVLEITESLLLQDVPLALERMRSLHAQGLGLSLDDFGTGFSSLSYLKHMPLDELKLDRSFVTDVDKGDRDRALAAAVITLGKMLDLRVIAEGVETEAQAAELAAMGCHLHQGFLYARPMPAAHFADQLAWEKPAGDADTLLSRSS